MTTFSKMAVSFMLNVANNPFMLSVLMLNVIVLSDVAPAWRKRKVNVLQTSFIVLSF